jgi:hypothetical protein
MNNRKWSTWTSILFLVPGFLAFRFGNILLCFVLISVAVSSTLYHMYKPQGPDWWWHKKALYQHILQIVDTFFSLAASGFVVSRLLATNSKFVISVILVFCILSLKFFFVYRTQTYERSHGWWHVLASITVTIVLLFT